MEKLIKGIVEFRERMLPQYAQRAAALGLVEPNQITDPTANNVLWL
jgi:hypothetical protein